MRTSGSSRTNEFSLHILILCTEFSLISWQQCSLQRWLFGSVWLGFNWILVFILMVWRGIIICIMSSRAPNDMTWINHKASVQSATVNVGLAVACNAHLLFNPITLTVKSNWHKLHWPVSHWGTNLLYRCHTSNRCLLSIYTAGFFLVFFANLFLITHRF